MVKERIDEVGRKEKRKFKRGKKRGEGYGGSREGISTPM